MSDVVGNPEEFVSYHGSNYQGQCSLDVAQINLLYVCVCQMASHSPKHADTTKKFGISLGTGFHSHNTIRRPTLKVAPAVMKANRLMCWAIHPMTRELRALTPPKHIRIGPRLYTPIAQFT